MQNDITCCDVVQIYVYSFRWECIYLLNLLHLTPIASHRGIAVYTTHRVYIYIRAIRLHMHFLMRSYVGSDLLHDGVRYIENAIMTMSNLTAINLGACEIDHTMFGLLLLFVFA